MDIVAICISAGVPSAVLSLGLWLIEQKLNRQHKESEEKRDEARQASEDAERRRERGQILLIDSVNASIKLSETIADGCKKSGLTGFNGNVEEAKKYAEAVRNEQNNYYRDIGIKSTYK